MTDYSHTIFKLVEYEIRCNFQSIEFLAGLSDEELKHDFGFGLRTPHRTMFHIIDVIQGWSGCVGPSIRQPSWLTYSETVPLHEMRALLVKLAESWLDAARTSHDQGLLDQDGRLNQVFHLVTHGTHHRGQLLSMITLMGYDQPFEGGDFGGWSNTPEIRNAEIR